MWESVEARFAENEGDKPVALRPALYDVLRGAGLRPGGGITKKMVSFEFGTVERLLWEIQNPANFFLHEKWRGAVEAGGFTAEPRAFQNGAKDGGRHSALSRDWSFGSDNCFVVRIESPQMLQRLLGILMNTDNELILNPAAITRWIGRLRHFFPSLDRFDQPDPQFDEAERTYKLQVAAELREAIARQGSDQDIVEAIHSALAKSNLLQWRAYWPMSPKGDADRVRLWPALRQLADAATGPADGHALALEAFVSAWIAAVPNGKPDPARQIGEFLFLHLAPDEGVYIRHSVRQDLWLEAVGSRFPDHVSMADTYRTELRFMQAVRSAFAAQGLAPRDMIDVQGALWVVHNYKEAEMAMTRSAIEGAMDAYDLYLQSGEHGQLFDAFGTPQTYWVRSSRQRPNRVYPSKQVAAFALDKPQLNGGWGQKADAAAQLHNAGYIIVDEDDQPLEPPEQDHLIHGADRARRVALTYFIDPARERGEAQVTVRVGDVSRNLVPAHHHRNVWQALKGKAFQDLANVPVPTQTGVDESPATTFAYQLSPANGQSTMTPDLSIRTPTTNLILYGPPGTGKTHATAWEAVRLCLGDGAMAPFSGTENRAALMAEYRRLTEAGRIDFVTFHQSISYEEFVEGLRPNTGRANGPEVPLEEELPSGFRLEAEDGVFKRLSDRAAGDRGDAAEGGLDRSQRIIRLGLTGGDVQDLLRKAIDENAISWRFGGDTDWSGPEYEEWEEIKQCRQGADPTVKGNHATVYGTWMVRYAAADGEYVLLTDGRNRAVALGRLAGGYQFKPATDGHPAEHKRPVDWIWHDPKGIERSSFYDTPFTSFHPIYPLDGDQVDWAALETAVLGPRAQPAQPRPHVLIIDEINRANISKVFGELITLLETDKRLGTPNEIRLTLPYSRKSFGVPANLHIIGTMNTADRSIALLDTALRRRFTFRELMPDPEVLPEILEGIHLRKLLRRMNERIEYLFDREHQIGHAYFTGCTTRAAVEDVMRHRVIPLLAEYFYEDWSKVAAVLGDTKQDKPRFLIREEIRAPEGMEADMPFGGRHRWRVKPERDSGGNGGFDFAEFETP